MKNKFTNLFLLITSVLINFNLSFAGDRTILVERFTSSTCGPCASANPSLESFLGSADPNKVLSVSYHMNWPAPGNDPMYLANPNDNTIRRTVYGVNSIPYWFFDGTYVGGTSLSLLQSAYNSRTNVLSPVTIVVTESRNGSTVSVKADIYCEFALSNPNATVYLSVNERLVSYSSPPGTNGERNFHDVMRKVLPTANGIPVTLLPGKVISIDYTYTIEPSWQASEIENIVFVQGYANEIINTATKTLNFNLTSAPSFKVVNQGVNQSADYSVKIPVTASGYNSLVSFTAELETPVSGITTQFTGGNTISNFPDSLGFRVSSTSGVPNGVYKVIITGTNTSGVVHKTIVNYLVGMNYAVFGANRPQVTYKVDNTSYSSSRLFTWNIGSSHTIEAVSPITQGNTRYVFENWSNGGPILQNITVGTQEINVTANFKIQYKLIGQYSPAGIPVTLNGVNVFYDSSSTASISVTPLHVQYNGQTYHFQGWEGTGAGSYTGPNPTPQIQVNNILVQKAIYDTIDVGITNYSSVIPSKFGLYQNFPNPFNPSTSIRFDLPKSVNAAIVVYNALGKEVTRLVNENLSPGSYQVTFNAGNLASGVYYYKLEAESFTQIKKLVLIK